MSGRKSARQNRVRILHRMPTHRRDIPGSTAFVPSVVGLIIAGEVVKDLCRFDHNPQKSI